MAPVIRGLFAMLFMVGFPACDEQRLPEGRGEGVGLEPPLPSPCYEAGENASGKTLACDWITVEGGTYMMGSPEGMGELPCEYPQHQVHVPTFKLWRTENTVAQYLACADAGWCEPLAVEGYFCNVNYPSERATHPINCISWFQARDLCEWLGGRLASEAEWEFAARSRGQDILYPWGDEAPTCERAVIDLSSIDPDYTGPAGCDGIDTTQPVCSKPLGNSAEGFCDFAGNVYSWTEDWFHQSYVYSENGVAYSAPSDGGAWLEPPSSQCFRVLKGGGIGSPGILRPTFRQYHAGDFAYGGLGVRCAKDVE